MSLFPVLYDAIPTKEKEIPKEYEIDFKTIQLTGKIVEGLEAIKIWIWFALKTPRYRHYIYSWDYGNELEDLIGQGYSEEYISIEAQNMVEDCLLINKNIESITNFSAFKKENQLIISFTANTLYGSCEVKIDV